MACSVISCSSSTSSLKAKIAGLRKRKEEEQKLYELKQRIKKEAAENEQRHEKALAILKQ